MNTNIDVLVNNAGSGVRGHTWKTKIERNHERILMVGSSASFQRNPLLAKYAGTKAFITSYTDALIDELKETKVTATLLVLGPTNTVRFTSVCELHSLFSFFKEFFRRTGANKDFLESMKMLDDPKDVAQRAYQALLNGDHRVYGSAKI